MTTGMMLLIAWPLSGLVSVWLCSRYERLHYLTYTNVVSTLGAGVMLSGPLTMLALLDLRRERIRRGK